MTEEANHLSVWWRSLVATALVVLAPHFSKASSDSCKCEPANCGPCETLTGTDFYTAPCEGNKTKSCQKPRCEPMRNPPKGCESSTPKVADAKKDEAASVELSAAKDERRMVGVFSLVRGNIKLIKFGGKEVDAHLGTQVHEKDFVITDDTAQGKILFQDKNILNIAPKSKLRVRGYETEDVKGYSSGTLDLIYGKVRASVVTRPKFADKPHFLIRTPAAVAGVRGTDFVVTHVENGDVSKVETLEGAVELRGHGKDDKVVIKRGQYASYVIVAGAEAAKVFEDDDINTFVQRGFLTPIYKMSEQEYDKLNVETDFQNDGSDRIVAEARKEKPICSAPSGFLNQCVWQCKGNPSGESRCRADLPGVSCVRKRCDANGRWAAEERVPASSVTVKCDGGKAVVGPCDY